MGRRRVPEAGPHSIPLVALGTGLLWFGWYGFNAGSEFRVDSVTAVAFLNTDLAASFAADVWGVHGVGGYLGIFLLGVFASTAWNPAASGGVDGLLRGGTRFFLVQWGAVTLASAGTRS